MDFFAAQDDAHRRTKWLILYYALAVIGITICLNFVILAAYFVIAEQDTFWNFDVVYYTSAVTILTILVASGIKISELKSGGAAVAKTLGGIKVNSSTQDPDERKLLNIVEEMSIASGVPRPDVFILEQDNINAFAAGFTINDAVVAVTRGTIHHLNRDELQGVVAHEFSHILNGDMRLNIRIIGVLYGILVIAITGESIFDVFGDTRRMFRRSSSKDSGNASAALFMVGLGIMTVGYIGVFFARLIQSAVSRQREFLADASSVQFTRNPSGIANALKKTATAGSRIFNAHAQETSHMFFSNAVSKWSSLFPTHPPLSDRIRAIEPNWDGKYIIVKLNKPQRTESLYKESISKKSASKKNRLMDSIGTIEATQLAFAHHLLSETPAIINEKKDDPVLAQAVIILLLLDHNEEVQQKQLSVIKEDLGSIVDAKVYEIWPTVYELNMKERLPLIEMLLPALSNLDEAELNAFTEALKKLILADNHYSEFELCLYRIVSRYIDVKIFKHIPKRINRNRNWLLPHINITLSYMAYASSDDKLSAEEIYKSSIDKNPDFSKGLKLLSREECGIEAVNESLDIIARATYIIRKQTLAVCVDMVVHDNSITLRESELLRAFSLGLECPMPPLEPTV